MSSILGLIFIGLTVAAMCYKPLGLTEAVQLPLTALSAMVAAINVLFLTVENHALKKQLSGD